MKGGVTGARPGRREAVLPLAVVLSSVVGLPSLLSACAVAAPPVRVVSEAMTWTGRLSLWLDTNPPQTLSAGFDLSGHAQAGHLLLLTPLGTTVASIEWRQGYAELVAGDRHERHASLSDLTVALTGTNLPVQALFRWLRGEDAGADGWEVDLSQHGAGRLEAQRHTPSPAARLRLVFEAGPTGTAQP